MIGPGEDDPGTLTIPEALHLAVSLHRSGRVEPAEGLYLRILEAVPDQPDALHFLGILRHQQGRSGEAADLIRRAIEGAPGHTGALINLGNILKETGRLEEAADVYREALSLAPEDARATNNLGVILKALGDLDGAEDAYRRALALDPTQVLTLRNLANLARLRGRLGEASGLYREWLVLDPGNAEAEHLLACCGGAPAPLRASDGYLRAEFDHFAREFDAHLLRLGYRAPALLADALDTDDRDSGRPGTGLIVLDAGCGTGLAAPLLRRRAERLVGVDLSAGMLERARARGGYDELHAAELAAFLHRSPPCYDLVFAADTLCYFGPLGNILAAAAEALRPEGRIAFTLEAAKEGSDAPAFLLAPSGRYRHTQAHVRSALAAAGLGLRRMDRATLRREQGVPVEGLVVLAVR